MHIYAWGFVQMAKVPPINIAKPNFVNTKSICRGLREDKDFPVAIQFVSQFIIRKVFYMNEQFVAAHTSYGYTVTSSSNEN